MTREHIRRRKLAYLWRLQSGQCAITGQFLEGGKIHDKWYAQLHHAVEKSKVNQRLYPLFLHSVWNLHLVKAGEHGTFATPKGLPNRVALKIEAHLQSHPDIAALVNLEIWGEIHVDEVAQLFVELLAEVWPERTTGMSGSATERQRRPARSLAENEQGTPNTDRPSLPPAAGIQKEIR